MPRIDIQVPSALHRRVEEFLKQGGFARKAELFRHALILYMDQHEKMLKARKAGLSLPLKVF